MFIHFMLEYMVENVNWNKEIENCKKNCLPTCKGPFHNNVTKL